jgi:hypothetical protein
MSLGDRLGLAGLAMALIGIAIPILWPDKKWIGWLSLILAVLLAIGWAVLEIRKRFGTGPMPRAASIVLGAVVVGGMAVLIWHSAAHSGRCSVSVSSAIVARLYAITGPPAVRRDQDLAFAFQELFYEWNANLIIEGPIPDATLEINNLTKDDRMNVLPEDSFLSELRPRWMSGFDEPTHSPDYYSRVIRFADVDSHTRAGRVSVRRLMQGPVLSNTSIVRVVAVHSTACHIDMPRMDEQQEISRLNKQATILASWKYAGPDKPAPVLILGLGDAPPGRAIATIEARCGGEDCKHLIIRQLEVRTGKTD